MTATTTPELSVIIPVYNEEAVLEALFARLYPSLDALKISYEVIFINDGSRDRSAGMLSAQYEKRPDVTRVILFNGNFGQHRAILAGFEHARGARVVTLDADLQNPPEEIGKLLAKMDEGYDYVGSIREQRNDSVWRHVASRIINMVRDKITNIRITDHGCMMRAYDRRIVQTINQCQEMNTFIPALAYSFSQHPTEVTIKHEERFAGESKYSFYKLIRLNFDLMTGFSLVPLQFFSMAGMIISPLSGLLVLYMLARRVIIGPEVDGVFTLFAIVFFMLGIALFGIGMLGEYIGRIYQEVRQRPRYLIAAVLEKKDA
ncbi:MAG TPA: glycosyltransferase [Stenotrophobium sp.]|nr:glycosyltransferase [Stenotrophobium sp.]